MGIDIKKQYDVESDILYIKFASASSAKGVQLTENILLRLDPISGEALGLAIHNYTKITAQGLADPLIGLPNSDHETLLRLFNSEPLNKLLVLKRDTVSLGPALIPEMAKAA